MSSAPPWPRAAERTEAGAPHDALDELPLSWGQKGLWIESRLAPDSAAYNLAVAMRLRTADGPPVEAEVLRRAFAALAERHPALRTTFALSFGGEPVQRVHERLDPDFAVCEAAVAWSEPELERRLVEEARRPFDLEQGPLLRVLLFRRCSGELVTLVVIHHLVADFGSVRLLAADLAALAAGAGLAPPPRAGYGEHVRRERERLAGPEGGRLWDYWSARLAAAPDLDLPADRPRAAVRGYRGGAVPLRLGKPLPEGILALARGGGTTPFTVLLTAFQALLARLTGQPDLVVGCRPRTARDRFGRWSDTL